jgi:two-component system repressor protein LuxO
MLPSLEEVRRAAIAAPSDAGAPARAVAAPLGHGWPAGPAEVEPLALAERRYIENAIAVCGGNLQLAARRLGISPSTIYRKKEGWAQDPP